jgi:hypothetical protein
VEQKFSRLRFSEFAKKATMAAVGGAVALQPIGAKAATGSIQVHAGNAVWFLNTNITFSTTSSNWGFSEASLHTGGGTRQDAYDGALSWHVYAGAVGTLSQNGYRSPGGVVDILPSPASLSDTTVAKTVDGKPQTIAGLNVTGQVYFSVNKAVARNVLFMQNPTGADITVSVLNASNLGSDNNTSIQATSSGDNPFNFANDHWVVSCQQITASPGTCDLTADPILTFAMSEAGAPAQATAVQPIQNGSDKFYYSFNNITVPAGQTRALMILAQLSDTVAHATTDAALFNSAASLSGTDYLSGLTAAQKAQIVNWNLPIDTLTVNQTGFGSGTVTSAPAGINCGATCSAQFSNGTQVTLTATPSAGSVFGGWSGGGCSGTGTCQVTLASATTTVTATFTAIRTVTVTPAGTGSGSVASAPPGISCGATCSAPFADGTQVTLTATPVAGSVFSGWSGGTCSGTSPCTFTVSANTNVTATFAPITRTLTVSEAGGGQVTSAPAGINCSPTSNQCSAGYPNGTPVTLTASPNSGFSFAGWGGACSGTGACQVTMSADMSVTATFNPIPSFPVSVVKIGAGSGTLSSTPLGINCGATCTASFASGTQITLMATPNAGSVFSGWSGGTCSGTSTCNFTVSTATTVTASFALITRTLTVTETGGGQVTSAPAGINCSPTSNQCSAGFADGTQVTLTASANSGSTFGGWGGACSGTSTCQVTMSADTSVSATFTQNTGLTLSVANTGTGSGTVTSSPSGISCGSTCSATFAPGTQVTLSGAAAAGSTFTGWSGGGCAGTTPCALTVTANTAISAGFVANSSANVNLLAAVLPDSRSLQVGQVGTAFATVLNAGSVAGSACAIAPATGVPASFTYQTTNPATNAVTGTPNTPVTIPAGGSQSFVLALTPTAPFPPTDVAFIYTCANSPTPAPSVVGLNTLNVSASTSPVPDIIAVSASTDPGYMDVTPGRISTGFFAIATFDLGIGGTFTVSADTGAANLPLTLTVCQTDPQSGACLATPAPTVKVTMNNGDKDTFGVFAEAAGIIADMPAVNRVFARFTDSNGVLRGSTSVAVRTH